MNVPEVNMLESGKLAAALSLNTKLILLTALKPPASDIMRALAPVGPTSNISISSGVVCANAFNSTCVATTFVPNPENEILDG